MSNLQLVADELGDIRALVRTLKARETVLRNRILDRRPNAPIEGQKFVVDVRSSARRRVDVKALPSAIVADDRYWITSNTQTVVVRPV